MTKKGVRKPGRPVDPRKDEHILDAAHQLVVSEGLQAVTMERVAQVAGVSKVTLYARFANRNELLSALVGNHVSAIHQALGPVPTTLDGFWAGLASFARALKRYIHGQEYRQVVMVMGSIPQSNHDLCAVYENGPAKAHQVLADYLAAASSQGMIDCSDPLESAETLIGMICGLDILRVTYRVDGEAPGPEQIREFADRIVRAFMVMHGVHPG